jgi:sulfate adenylyltransferase subunit 2
MLLDKMEDKSLYILREAFSKFERLTMLWAMGKDSTAQLWLAREAFFGHEPLALVQVDTSYKTKERCFSRRDGHM